MNIFGFITIGLVLTAVLLIYYAEIPRLRRETRKEDESIAGWFGNLSKRVQAIESARGTFSRRLDDQDNKSAEEFLWLNNKINALDSLVHSIGDKVDKEVFDLHNLSDRFTLDHIANIRNWAGMQTYLDSQKKPDKKKKSGK
jgi:hypothetical protein